jgi:tetratricopeptide (TPR) repeat protein
MILAGCTKPCGIDPHISYSPPDCLLESFQPPFPPLSPEEMASDWGKELYIGLQFAQEQDYYRAITCYKRALFLAPPNNQCTCEYHLVETYYLAGKYEEAISVYECSSLGKLPLEFPALKELLIMLEDSYYQLDRPEKACRIRLLIEQRFPETASNLTTYQAVKEADFCTLNELAYEDEDLNCFLASYVSEKKSPERAQLLNALLPGAGYYYVGQKKSAVTSFVINALFTWASYRFFERGYPAAGFITASLEVGWYCGGINGAGLAAEELNQCLYEAKAKEFLIRQKLFPILQFEYAF